MSNSELILCMSSVFFSSLSQIFFKMASFKIRLAKIIAFLGFGGLLQLLSVVFAVLALRAMTLSQIVPFAAVVYLLVPIYGRVFFQERLCRKFVFGSTFIVFGVLIINV